ncbi:glycogen debranching protein GlgX [Mesorhizobium sp. GR13]|uniref:glycogen debranching protein GlgX n=1 Tax=Mesorhizobium sp. GR13 TaxID=2562308 RepID=UPI0010C09977|nr:glycogen debranching protein GlgX [Mesorhizobium sp. GR13]
MQGETLKQVDLGANVQDGGVLFAVWSGTAKAIWLCLFDAKGSEARVEMLRGEQGVFSAFVAGAREGQRYGFRADGDYAPLRGLWFDPDKLLIDPYAVELDGAYSYDPNLALARGSGIDTAPLLPKAIVRRLPEAIQTTPFFHPGGLIYELQMRAFTKLHPDIPERVRGTVGALAHPAIIEHLKKLHVSAVELMPITAWMDERHLPPLGLHNAWGYNPVSFMALDPRLCPGGVKELRETVAALHKAGIGVILDLVFNHTAESDIHGPTLSLRGLDAQTYYRSRDGRLANDTGTGNTVACDRPVVQRLVLDSLRHFVRHAGVDGFRLDLAPILGRDDNGFDARAALLRAMRDDPLLGDRVLIAEPWDIGRDGYQLGNFGDPFLEWNDRARDDFRRFWRGDAAMVGALATALAGSSDVFQRDGQDSTRTVNFIAAHDGLTLTDLVSVERKHNEANGENNRDGHDENYSWNNGVEGGTDDAKILAARARDLRALLATLFASRGAIMLTAGDEFGHTQHGNNNAYCQDNELTWLDWAGRDRELEGYAFRISGARADFPLFGETHFLTGSDVEWLTEAGDAMSTADWEDPARRRLCMVLNAGGARLAVLVNGDRRKVNFGLPERDGYRWRAVVGTGELVEGRSVAFLREVADDGK